MRERLYARIDAHGVNRGIRGCRQQISLPMDPHPLPSEQFFSLPLTSSA